ncbi:MAG: hypothetical protein HYZ15_13055 [Sphingobacteriales bacterium]|nr:hypothetical protein [Sphingobacteriales bacterium]
MSAKLDRLKWAPIQYGKQSSLLRIVTVREDWYKGREWLISVDDVFRFYRLIKPRKLRHKLALSEFRDIHAGLGRRERFVSVSGLLSLVPQTSDAAQIRRSLVEFIYDIMRLENEALILTGSKENGENID